jgi:ketosteroid isomerase-like protein
MRAALAVVVVLGAGAAARADIAVLQSVADNTLFQSATGATSNGAGPNVFAGRTTQGSIRRALLRFDLASIPSGATVTSVTLQLHASQTQGGTTPMNLHRTLAAWGEGGSVSTGGGGAPSQPGDATWIHTFFSTSFWANAGGDFASTPSATTPVGNPGDYTWSSTDLVTDVQGWLAAPGNNFGWMLRGDEANFGTAKRFESHEDDVLANQPRLTVEYVVPAPAGVGMLAVGGLLGARRRRR